MRKDPVHTYIEELKTNLKKSEVTKEFQSKLATMHRNSERYDFEYRLRENLDLYFTLDYKGDFENDHEFTLSFYLDNPTTEDFMMHDEEVMKMYVKKDTFPTSQIYTLYLSFLEMVKQTFDSHHFFRLLWITGNDLFINEIKKEGFEELWESHMN